MLKMPHHNAIRERIKKLGQDTIQAMHVMFQVYAHATQHV